MSAGTVTTRGAPPGAARRIFRRRRQSINIPPLRGLLPLILALVVWQLVQHGNSAYFPRPSLWWHAISVQWDQGALSPSIHTTLTAFIYSLIIATIVGTVLGIQVGRSETVDRTLGPLLDFCRFMPAAAIVPVVVLFAGYSQKMTIFVVVFSAIWPILLQVRDEMRSQSVLLDDVAKCLQLGRWRAMRTITLPSLTPAIILGVRVAAPMVLIVTLLVEIVTQTGGLGKLIMTAQQNFDAATAYGMVAIAGLFGVMINVLVAAIEARLLRYRPDGG